jgi:hypothetical protein
MTFEAIQTDLIENARTEYKEYEEQMSQMPKILFEE